MLTKIIGPEPLREEHVRQAIYYYGFLGCKPLIFQDPDNKACILVGDDDPVYTVNPMPNYALLDSYFKSRFPTKVKTVEVKPLDRDKTLATVGRLLGQFTLGAQTQEDKQFLCATLGYIMSIYAYEDLMPDLKLSYEVNESNGLERWVIRNRKIITDPTAAYANIKIESFLRDHFIAYNKHPLYSWCDTDFILSDIVDFSCAILASAYPSINLMRTAHPDYAPNLLCGLSGELMTDPVTAADGYNYEKNKIEEWFAQENNVSPITWQRMLNQKTQPNPLLKKKVAERCFPQTSMLRDHINENKPVFHSPSPRNI